MVEGPTGAIEPSSQHLSFWHNEAIPVLSSSYFLCPHTNKRTVPRSLTNWIFSIRNLEYIWRKLRGEGFKYLIPRNLNQDPLENFFGDIRAYGGRNINSTCAAFICSFKALLTNNFLSPHSVTSNYEEDESEGAFTNFG